MEQKSQFLKFSEKPEEKLTEQPIEQPLKEAEEIVIPEAEKEKALAELEKEQKEQKEKGEFFDKIQKDEQEMAGGILRKFAEAPTRLKKGIMILAAAGMIFSAGKAFAGGETWSRTHQGWQNNVRQVERMPQQYGARESQKAEAIQHQYQLKERARFDAYQDYQQQTGAIQKSYEQRKFDIMIGRVEGATDYFGKQKAYQELEQWRYNEEMRARQDWSLKVWATEEEYRQKARQIQQWR